MEIGRGEDRMGNADAPRRRYGAPLAELHKALKALGFYPDGHPRRAEAMERACRLLRDAMGGAELVLVIGKAGFLATDGGAAVEQNPMTLALARELFIRRVRRLTILPDLSGADLTAFLSLLTLDHRAIPAAGGMEGAMAGKGITTIWANELDLTEILRKRRAFEAAAGEATPEGPAAAGESGEPPLPAGAVEAAAEIPLSFGVLGTFDELSAPEPPPPGGEVEELLARLDLEYADDRYGELARLLVEECDRLKEREEFGRLLPILDGLLGQGWNRAKSLVKRSYALLAFEQAASGAMVEYLARLLEETGGDERELLYAIFRQLGYQAVDPLIERLALAETLAARRNLAAALVAVGEEAAGLLAERLGDERWYVVRNVASILGEIGAAECVAPLAEVLGHPDGRVRREVVRSLAMIGGAGAEAALIGLLGDPDPSVARQAVVSLGQMRSRSAVEPLCALIADYDPLLRSLPLKKEAVQALGRIGDRRAVPALSELFDGRRLLARQRWEELRIAAASALGLLGDPLPLLILERFAGGGGRLAVACGEAAAAIRRSMEASHG
ncbi:HEAT repeat domain-containing protein [Geobacter sp.]|uniref:HEAT repeat domain-containing protein n=1 Tax=Geobacter sp. TaxID=46610 RepID=UPI00261F1E3A|nr:HEAT repeat domain-containing protein [Geobacter sp.]